MRSLRISLVAVTMFGCAASAVAQAKALFLTHSAGFTHGVVKRVKRGEAAWAEHNLKKYAAPQFEVDCTQDCNAINAENLANYACVVFYTTGELPISEEGKSALFEWIENGGGFVGVHCATDTFYKDATYGKMIGGYFAGHPWHKKVGILVEDRAHPATALLGERFELTDEIYQFRDFAKDELNVLLRLDPADPEIKKGRHKDTDYYALAWNRDYGKGRVFYTALGHRREVWKDPVFLEHLTSGIRWAMGNSGALRAAPPGATVLFDGDDLDHWRQAVTRKPPKWDVADGVMTVRPGGGSIVTEKAYGSCRLHLEFRTPPSDPDAKGQRRGNSGVYLQRRYEVQILDSFGVPGSAKDCAAIYGKKRPDANVSRAPEEWQTLDIWFTAATFDDDGNKTGNARITVIHNDVLVHDDVEVDGKTGAGQEEGPEDRYLMLQDHGDPVSFRNIWILPTD